jgi:hypothetical protein
MVDFELIGYQKSMQNRLNVRSFVRFILKNNIEKYI